MKTKHSIPICDLHCDTPFEILAGKKINEKTSEVNLPDLHESNVGIQVFANYLSPNIPTEKRYESVSKMIAVFRQELKYYPRQIELCTTFDEIENARKQGKIAAVLAIENGMAIESDLDKLQHFYDEGIRVMTIIHSESSDWAISSNDKTPKFDGLSAFGEQVIKKMNQLGMLIDVSHAHASTVEKILSVSDFPVFASHSCAAAICPVPRNLTDAQIKKIAAKGGMVGINFFPAFLDFNYNQKFVARCGDVFKQIDEIEKKSGLDPTIISASFKDSKIEVKTKMADTRIPITRIIDHIDHIVQLAGEEYAGFGSDFDGVPDMPEGMESCAAFNLVRDVLFERNYSMESVEKICYKNFLNIFKKVCG